ncbi:MAG: class I SAM-dependent methyltransferase [Pseudomonadota bacterium]
MGLVFGTKELEHYERWLASPKGRTATMLESELILSLLEPRPGERLLDVGCGPGTHLELLRRRGLDVTGLDPSVPMLEAARQRLGVSVPLHLGYAEHLPFDDDAFDLCVFITSLEFVDDPVAALAEAARVARRRLLIGLVNPYSAHGLQCMARSLCGVGIYRQARFFGLGDMRRLIQHTLGDSPLRWRSVLTLPPSLCGLALEMERRLSRANNPFGAFLAMTVDLAYRYRLEIEPFSLPLSMRNRQRLAAGVGLRAA